MGTAGTIEEKVYHKQIQKQFLSTKVLKDPKQKRFFANTKMSDLMSLGEQYDELEHREVAGDTKIKTETSELLESTRAECKAPKQMYAIVAKARMKLSGQKRKKEKLEGLTIDHLAKRRRYKLSESAEIKTSSSNSTEDKDILTIILNNKNVSTCFDHNKVLKNSRESDFVLLENEAENKAKAAFAKIRQSAANSCHKNIPTFTGNGDNEAADLIKAIKARNLNGEPNNDEEKFTKNVLEFLKNQEEVEKTKVPAEKLLETINSWKLRVDMNFQMASLNLLAVQDIEGNWFLRKKKGKGQKKSKQKEKDQNNKPENKRLANTKIENPEEDLQKEVKFKKKTTDTVKKEAKYQGPSLFDIEFDKIEAKKVADKRENL